MIGCPAMLADKIRRSEVVHDLPGVLAVPFPPLVRSVPADGERADICKVSAPPFGEGGVGVLLMPGEMVVPRKAREIIDGIVERVAVDVMDVVPVGDRPVGGLPDLDVEVSDSRPDVVCRGSVIDAIRPALAVGIAPELHAVEHNGFPFNRHT